MTLKSWLSCQDNAWKLHVRPSLSCQCHFPCHSEVALVDDVPGGTAAVGGPAERESDRHWPSLLRPCSCGRLCKQTFLWVGGSDGGEQRFPMGGEGHLWRFGNVGLHRAVETVATELSKWVKDGQGLRSCGCTAPNKYLLEMP